jgi:proteasome beta subunit
MTIVEGEKLGIRAIHNAMKRDSGSGDVIQVVKITGDRYEVVDESVVEKIRQTL